jgi:hypothetical protein
LLVVKIPTLYPKKFRIPHRWRQLQRITSLRFHTPFHRAFHRFFRLCPEWYPVKRIAPNHAVDPDELLRKVPDLFPGDLVKQQEIDGFMSEFLVRTEGMTLAEK